MGVVRWGLLRLSLWSQCSPSVLQCSANAFLARRGFVPSGPPTSTARRAGLPPPPPRPPVFSSPSSGATAAVRKGSGGGSDVLPRALLAVHRVLAAAASPAAASTVSPLEEAELIAGCGVALSEIAARLTPEEHEALEAPLEAVGGMRRLLAAHPHFFRVALVPGGAWKATVGPLALPAPDANAATARAAVPPPPASLSPPPRVPAAAAAPTPPSASKKKAQRREELQQMFSPQHFTHVIPTFFVPLPAVVALLPGYQEEHLVSYFCKLPAVQFVRVAGVMFVRIHGGRREVSLARSGEAAAVHARHAVDPAWFALLEPLLQPPGSWHSPADLVSRLQASALEFGNAEAVQRFLSFHDTPLQSVVLFVLQFQHKFVVVQGSGLRISGAQPDTNHDEGSSSEAGTDDGATDASEQASGAGADNAEDCGVQVSLPPPGNASASGVLLDQGTTPCPVALQESLAILTQNPLEARGIAEKLSPAASEEMHRFFPSPEAFTAAHGGVFYFPPGTPLVVLASDESWFRRRSMTVEQKLQYAHELKDRKNIHKYRRKLVELRDATNPLLNNDILAAAACAHLPQRGFAHLYDFVRTLPTEIRELIPPFPNHFFVKYPDLCRLFEWRKPNCLCIMLPNGALPSGMLRSTYTDEEIALLVSDALQHRHGHSCGSSTLLKHLPFFARRQLLERGGLVGLLRRFPSFFSVVFRNARTLDVRGVMVSLLVFPTREGLIEDAARNKESGTGADAAGTSPLSLPADEEEDFEE